MGTWIPSTQDVRDGFALSYANDKEILSPEWQEATSWAEAAFDAWLSERDRELTATRMALAEALALLGEDEEANVVELDELHYLSENPGQREW